MPKVRPRKFSQTQQITRGEAAQGSKATKAQRSAPVARADEVDTLVAKGAAEAAAESSPLTDAVFRGLEELATKYYGSSTGPSDGLKVLLRGAEMKSVDIDKVMSPELRDMKALQISKDTGISKDAARELVKNLALLLAP